MVLVLKVIGCAHSYNDGLKSKDVSPLMGNHYQGMYRILLYRHGLGAGATAQVLSHRPHPHLEGLIPTPFRPPSAEALDLPQGEGFRVPAHPTGVPGLLLLHREPSRGACLRLQGLQAIL